MICSNNINKVHLDKPFSYCDRYLRRKNKSYGYYPDLKIQLPTMYNTKDLQNNCSLISSIKYEKSKRTVIVFILKVTLEINGSFYE